MKKSLAGSYSSSLKLPHITRIVAQTIEYRKPKRKTKQPTVKSTVPIPSDALVKELNRIGSEYPFCICYKQRAYDPL